MGVRREEKRLKILQHCKHSKILFLRSERFRLTLDLSYPRSDSLTSMDNPAKGKGGSHSFYLHPGQHRKPSLQV